MTQPFRPATGEHIPSPGAAAAEGVLQPGLDEGNAHHGLISPASDPDRAGPSAPP
jgi:hypothetical protein